MCGFFKKSSIVNKLSRFFFLSFIYIFRDIWRLILSLSKTCMDTWFWTLYRFLARKFNLLYFEIQFVSLRIVQDLKLKTIILWRHCKVVWLSNVTTRVMLLMSLSSEDMSFPSCPLFPSVNFVRRKPSTVNQWNEKTWTASPEIPWETLDKNRRAIFSWQHCDGTALLPNKDAEKESNNLQ